MEGEITELHHRFNDELKRIDDLTQVLLKGHLLIEEILNDILEHHLFHREHYPTRMRFADKVALCRALCLRKDKFGEWELINAINSLRNEIAHKLVSDDRDRKTRVVVDIYFREAAGMPDIEKYRGADHSVLVMNACAHCVGFLFAFLQDAKAYRAFVHAADRRQNPHLPEFAL